MIASTKRQLGVPQWNHWQAAKAKPKDCEASAHHYFLGQWRVPDATQDIESVHWIAQVEERCEECGHHDGADGIKRRVRDSL